MRCANCDAALPEGALFCIECGTPVERASTGATERLPERQGGPRCGACGTVNPAIAVFCVNCGRALGQTAPAGAPRPTLAPSAPPQVAQAQASPAPFEVPAVSSSLPFPAPPAISKRRRKRRGEVWGGISGGVFLIGMAILFATDTFWPGILALVGISAFLGALAGGELAGGVMGGGFMIGMAVLFATDTFWPGILVLCGIMAILGAVLRPGRRRGI